MAANVAGPAWRIDPDRFCWLHEGGMPGLQMGPWKKCFVPGFAGQLLGETVHVH